jgi:hypothetical protein
MNLVPALTLLAKSIYRLHIVLEPLHKFIETIPSQCEVDQVLNQVLLHQNTTLSTLHILYEYLLVISIRRVTLPLNLHNFDMTIFTLLS